MSPTSKALKYFRGEGYTCAITEHWNPFAKIRQDLFGFIDIIAINPIGTTVGIQTTTKPHMAERITKIQEHENFEAVRRCWEVWVVGFAPGASKASMEPRIVKL